MIIPRAYLCDNYPQLCYSEEVHKTFYASGFLYHSPTQQILLQQFKDDVQPVLFQGQKTHKDDLPHNVFQKHIESVLGITLSSLDIHPVYDYVHNKLGEQFIFYAEVTDIQPQTYSSKNKTIWFSLSKLSKVTMSEQTRHDIIIGERVIHSLNESALQPQDTQTQ